MTFTVGDNFRLSCGSQTFEGQTETQGPWNERVRALSHQTKTWGWNAFDATISHAFEHYVWRSWAPELRNRALGFLERMRTGVVVRSAARILCKSPCRQTRGGPSPSPDTVCVHHCTTACGTEPNRWSVSRLDLGLRTKRPSSFRVRCPRPTMLCRAPPTSILDTYRRHPSTPASTRTSTTRQLDNSGADPDFFRHQNPRTDASTNLSISAFQPGPIARLGIGLDRPPPAVVLVCLAVRMEHKHPS